MATITLDTAALSPEVQAALAVILAATPQAEVKSEWQEIAAHCRDRREVRWESGKAASSGMTSKQRRALAATLPKDYTTRQWNAAVKAFKAGGFR